MHDLQNSYGNVILLAGVICKRKAGLAETRIRRRLPNTIIVNLANGLELVKETAIDGPRFSFRYYFNNRRLMLNQLDDVWPVASLMVLSGYETDRLSALRVLNF